MSHDWSQALIAARQDQLLRERREDQIIAVLGGFAGGFAALVVTVYVAFRNR